MKSTLELNAQMQQQVLDLAKPGIEILESLTPAKCHIFHMGVALVGELLELELAWDNRDTENVVEELGDCEFYIEGMRQGLNALLPLAGATIESQKDLMEQANGSKPFSVLAEELLDSVKKYIIYNNNDKLDLVIVNLTNIRTQLNSLYQINPEMLTEIDSPKDSLFEAVMAHNFEKLGQRYPEGKFSDKDAAERKDKDIH